MTKVYLAASYSRHPELQNYAKDLQALGYDIVSRWILGEHAAHDNDIMGTGNAAFASLMAMEDEDDVMACDIFIHFTQQPNELVRRGGSHFEAGMARALGKELYIVGHYTNIFHRLRNRVVHRSVGFEGTKERVMESTILHAPVYFPDWPTGLHYFEHRAGRFDDA